LLDEKPSAAVERGDGKLQRAPRRLLMESMYYDLGYIDLEEKTLQPLNNPFGPKV
jgi:hypothetical protein